MRALPAALLGLLIAATPALAARPGERSPGGQRAEVSAPAGATAATAPRSKASAARPSRAERATAPIRGRVVVSRTRSAAIAVASGCPGAARSCRAPRMNWTEGLSPADGVQAAECPAGTMATLATGHSDVVRCMPI